MLFQILEGVGAVKTFQLLHLKTDLQNIIYIFLTPIMVSINLISREIKKRIKGEFNNE